MKRTVSATNTHTYTMNKTNSRLYAAEEKINLKTYVRQEKLSKRNMKGKKRTEKNERSLS